MQLNESYLEFAALRSNSWFGNHARKLDGGDDIGRGGDGDGGFGCSRSDDGGCRVMAVAYKNPI